MVLSKLKTLGAPAEPNGQNPLRAEDGSPITFPDLLEDNRRTWGTKIAFQQKVHREWRRISHADRLPALVRPRRGARSAGPGAG